MVGQSFRPAVDWGYVDELDTEEYYRHFVLRERAHAVIERAREAVAHSKELAWMLDEWNKQPLTSRCAWCQRYRVGGRWLDAARTPPIPADRTTHSICDACMEALRESKLSK